MESRLRASRGGRRDGEQAEPRRVAATLKLDPAHDTLRAEPEDRGLTVWKRSFAGIPVLDDVKVVKQLGKWRTRFHVVDTAPEPCGAMRSCPRLPPSQRLA